MSRKGKAANGSGSIRKRQITKNGRTHTYFEGRVTVGYDPITGLQKQRTVTGQTQREVAQKVREISAEVDRDEYISPAKITVAEWLEEWQRDYLTNVKDSTKFAYRRSIETHIIPHLGNYQLQNLSKPVVQRWVNALKEKGLSPKSIKNIHGILHHSLVDAVDIEYLRKNPAHRCKLPKAAKPDLYHLENEDIEKFLKAIDGHIHERLFKVALFTGLRENEVLGLTWDCVNFKNNTIAVTKQLCRHRDNGGQYYFAPPKDNEVRIIIAAPSVMEILREQQQSEMDKKAVAGDKWQDKNMVFSNPTGGYLSYRTVYDCYKRVTRKIGLEVRFHDLRHAYAALSLQAGDDVKTVQENLGHATPEFTLDVYSYVNQQMKKNSAERMENMIQSLGITG